MTINSIMLREIAEAEKMEREKRQSRDYDREVKRRLWHRRYRAMLEAAATVLVVATLALLLWCVVSDTPHRRGYFGGNESRQGSECFSAK